MEDDRGVSVELVSERAICEEVVTEAEEITVREVGEIGESRLVVTDAVSDVEVEEGFSSGVVEEIAAELWSEEFVDPVGWLTSTGGGGVAAGALGVVGGLSFTAIVACTDAWSSAGASPLVSSCDPSCACRLILSPEVFMIVP